VSTYHQIFVRTARSEGELVADVARAAKVRMTKAEDDYNPIKYGGKRPYAAVEIELTHDFMEDYGIPFEQYPIVITFRDFDQDMNRQEAFAKEVFDKLSSSGDYSMMLVYDLSTLLERTNA
jgi:hypothetical protein